MTEGVFPKADGEVLYASEVNNFYYGSQLGRVLARQAYQSNISDASGDEYFKTEKYTTASGSSGTTSIWIDSEDAYLMKCTDEASGDSTYDPDGATDVANCFDGNDATYASIHLTATANGSKSLGKTFSEKFVGIVKIKAGWTASGNPNTTTANVYVDSYDGSDWDEVEYTMTPVAGQGSGTITYAFALNKLVQGLRIRIGMNSDNARDHLYFNFYTLEYGNFDSSSIVKENSVFSKNPNSLLVYMNKSTPTNTSITFDISDDGGSTYEITGQLPDTPIDTSALTGTDISLKFNLATTDGSVTPKLYGWSAVITNT